MKRGAGHPACQSWEGESFTAYIHRLAQHEGYLGLDVEPPAPFRAKRDRRGFMERLEAIFAKRREPGGEG